MCTLTYIPSAAGYTFTHNRDERMDRPTSEKFQSRKLDNHQFYFPQDLEAHGTWIAFSTGQRSVCLLNGGSIAHERKNSYRQSRGLVVLDNFKFGSQEQFHQEYNFDDIEPFTLIIKDKKQLFQLIHNENDTQLSELDPAQPNIWSSTTLYTKEVRQKRERWFEQWRKKHSDPKASNIRYFHLHAGEGDSENDLVMSRWGILKTLSLTQIEVGSEGTRLDYQDFIQNTNDQIYLSDAKS